jgi:anthraniloyl-CoA monooxygenase
VKITVIGGGPAGLYFSILMKRLDRSHEITVFERNAPGDTFGWGVVFSDKTLSYLKDNDRESYEAITETFETWDNVDIVHRDRKISVGGNRFSGIARIALLNILQGRCREVGVDLRFRTEATDFDPAACDLLVGADGVNSAVRRQYEGKFGPELDVRGNKYIWYGTEQLFNGLTLTFRETASGVLAAHSYKFNKSLSTFIVECSEETLRAAGLDRMPEEEGRAFLERVFERDLGGRALLSNNSKWINFVMVKNRRWSAGNVVLLGDALHTAHFSIGSGTKLALEDAIALRDCFASGGGAEDSLREFERVRRPVVEEYQDAAYESLHWFESVAERMYLEPLPFAYSLMTRSKRVDYDSLRRRDPAFIAAYDEWRQAQPAEAG